MTLFSHTSRYTKTQISASREISVIELDIRRFFKCAAVTILRRQDAIGEESWSGRLGDLDSQRAMSVFRQESLSEEVNRESVTLTTVAGGSVALQFKASISSTSSSSTQTTSETVVQRMVGECLSKAMPSYP